MEDDLIDLGNFRLNEESTPSPELKKQEAEVFVNGLDEPEGVQELEYDEVEEEIEGDLLEIIESVIPHLEYLNYEPQKNHPYSVNTDLKESLKAKLDAWELLLSEEVAVDETVALAHREYDNLQKLYQRNLTSIISEVSELECGYHATDLFFKNTGLSKDNIYFLNASLEQLTDLDNTVFFDAVQENLGAHFDRLDLSENYSLLVIPGYLKSNRVLEKWSKLAYENKLLLITDFMQLDSSQDVVELFEDANLASADQYKANTIMTCNWLLARGKYQDLEKSEPLYTSSAVALAGRIYQNLIAQASAGATFGVLKGIKGITFPLMRSDISIIEIEGLIPIAYDNGSFIAYASKTLFNGGHPGLKSYNVVRVFDYLTKVLIDFFNRRTFENFNAKVRKELTQQIVDFLDECSGPNKLIESFTIKRFELDHKNKNLIHLDLRIEPFFPSKNFVLKMDFDGSTKKWGTGVEAAI